MGQVAIGSDPLRLIQNDLVSFGSIVSFFVASTLWTVIYDTIHAHQNLQDDVKFGIKSMAVFDQGHVKPLLLKLVLGMVSFLGAAGYLAEFGFL